LLTIPYLMFVSLLPFSTSMLTAFSLSQPVALVLYFGNQFMLALLLAIQWHVARRQGLLTGDDPVKRQAFAFVVSLQPVSFAISLVLAIIAPGRSMTVLAVSQAVIAATGRQRGERAART